MSRAQRIAATAGSIILCSSVISGCGALSGSPISNATANSNPQIEKINWYSPEQRRKEAARQERDASEVSELRSSNGASVAIAYARTKIGIPYLWGGNGTADQGGRFDCSGLTKAAYAKAGIELPRVANDQYEASTNHPSRSELKPGDLVFFGQRGNSRSIHHVGIYLGDGEMLHAPRTGTLIRINDVSYMNDYFGATRVA
jgi:cell wall-associated NlpC family hydrolase